MELFLAEHLEDYDYPDVIEKILRRNDLPGQITRDALLGKAKLLLKTQQWDQAEVIADRILSIEENPNARWVKWVTTTARGDQIKAEAELKLTKGKMPAEALRGFMILGWLYMDDTNRANQLLKEFQREKLGLALVSRDLAEFVRDNMDESVIGEAE